MLAEGFRTATAADMDALQILDAICFPDGDPDHQRAQPGELEEAVAAGAVSVFEQAGEILGFGHVDTTSQGRIYLAALGVAPPARGRHIGRNLLDHCLKTVGAQVGGSTKITTVTSPRNVEMLRVLFSRGFVVTQVMKSHFGRGRDRVGLEIPPHRPLGEGVLVSGGDLAALTELLHDGKYVCVDMKSTDSGLEFQAVAVPMRNSQLPWDDFDTKRYWEKNYVDMIDEDREIIDKVSRFFASVELPPRSRALDVGTGANLYPALLMLPFSGDVTLWEYSRASVFWLQGHLLSIGSGGSETEQAWPWAPFWSVMCERSAYRIEPEVQVTLGKRAKVVHDSLFNLPLATWDVGTMFFVAESMTADIEEFNRALACFFDALRPGAPFAMAFMEHSTGYDVNGVPWPAVNIGQDELARGIGSAAESLTITRIEVGPEPLRDGYTGMLLAYGRSAR